MSRGARRARLKALVACLSVAALTVTAVPTAGAAAADDPWLDERFSEGVAGVFDSGWGFSPTSSGHVGPGLVSRIPRGEHWGSSGHWNLANHVGTEPTEMWWRYWIKFPEGFRVDEPSRGKLPGPAGLYTYNCLGGRASTPGEPCWSARMMFSRVYPNDGEPSYPYDPDAVTRIGFYAYLLTSGGTGKTGEVMPWDADVATLKHGRWYCVEGRVKLNTPGTPNGLLEGWVDGASAFQRTGLTFRRSSEGDIRVKSFWFDVYYGGSATSPADNSILFDSLALDDQRVGCDDSAPGTDSGTFFDDDGSVFEADIERLAASGITKGCADGRFCPDDPVTRGQMAAFLHRALGDRISVTLPQEPAPPPTWWGARSHLPYTDALALYREDGAALDTYVLTYPIDTRGDDKDWMASGTTDNPNHWVPIQLKRTWEAGATPYVRITVSDLPGLANGRHDPRVRNMLAAFRSYLDASPGSRIILDILPGSNHGPAAWGDDPQNFKPAFRALAADARSVLGASRVEIVFTQSTRLKSSIFDPDRYGAGGYVLYWPGAEWVDAAGISGHPTSASASPGTFYGPAVDEMASVAGPGVPIVLTEAGVPADPSPSAQVAYAGKLASWAADHPQIVGIQWDDIVYGGDDMRISTTSGLRSGFAAGIDPVNGNGVDWLFSTKPPAWSRQRLAAQPFDDALTSIFGGDIIWLAATGITKGCGERRFCPDEPVTRGQMAAFLDRGLGLASPSSEILFRDTAGSIFRTEISRLANAGITRGCNPPANDRFCPSNSVTRGQMAAFLVRAGLTD